MSAILDYNGSSEEESMEIEVSASSPFQSLQSPLRAVNMEFITLRQSKRVAKRRRLSILLDLN